MTPAQRSAGVMLRLSVTTAVALGLVAALTADVPDAVPAWALAQGSVYRTEVGFAVTLGLYLASVMLHLAATGRVFTRISAAGASLEVDSSSTMGVLAGHRDAEADLRRAIRSLEDRVDDLEKQERR